MRITIEIPDALALEATALEQQSGVTLRELVVSGLRAELERRAAPSRGGFHFPTVSGDGLTAELAPEDVVSRSYVQVVNPLTA